MRNKIFEDAISHEDEELERQTFIAEIKALDEHFRVPHGPRVRMDPDTDLYDGIEHFLLP